MDVVVVGAGIGGLSVARELLGRRHIRSVRVLEANDRVGGRIRTTYDADGRPLYECGAWRIPEAHTRVLGLCRELGLELLPVASEAPEARRGWLGPRQECARRGGPGPGGAYGAAAATLSDWDELAARDGICAAELATAKTGYAGLDVMALGTDAYGVHELQRPARFFVPARGLSSICEALAREVAAAGASVVLKARVVDVVREADGYRVTSHVRTGANAFRCVACRADIVVLAVPPRSLEAMPGLCEPLAPILAAVQSVSLVKLFSEAGPDIERLLGLDGSYHFKSDTLAQQLISNTYPGTNLVQLAYAAGRRADALERLRLGGDLLSVVAGELGDLRSSCQDCARALRAALLAKPHHVHYWRDAVHVWLPSFDLDVERKSHEACVLPHLLRLPNLYLCGEALSTVQGWSEGALRTARDVLRAIAATLDYFDRHGRLPPPGQVPRLLNVQSGTAMHRVIYDGRLLDVGAWLKVHPGTPAAIQAHLGEDVTELFRAMAHPRYALGFLFALQVGWLLPVG